MKLTAFIKRRFLRPPAWLVLAAIVGPFAAAPSARGEIIYPLEDYRLRFDLSDNPARPPYTYFLAFLTFNGLDLFEAGDGFTAQLFDSSNHAASNSVTFAYHGPAIREMAFDFSLYEPFADDAGFIQFSNFTGSIALELDQYILVSNGVSATGFVPAYSENFVFRPVPEPATYGLFGALGVLGLALRRIRQRGL